MNEEYEMNNIDNRYRLFLLYEKRFQLKKTRKVKTV